MSKHLLGVTIFIFIVTIAALIYGFSSMPAIPLIPAVASIEGQSPGTAAALGRSLATRIITAEFDVQTGSLAADVELAWNGPGPPPATLEYRIYLLQGSDDDGLSAVITGSAVGLFSETHRAIRRITFSSQ